LLYKQLRLDLQDSTGKTPLHIAAGIGCSWAVKALLSANADPLIEDKMHRSAAKYAKQKGNFDCAQAIDDAVASFQREREEVALSKTSAFAPFLIEGDQTSPNSNGLSQAVYHQVQWLIFLELIAKRDISERVMGYLQSSETSVLLSALKDFEERCVMARARGDRISLEEELSYELSRVRTVHGIWQGLVPGKHFGFILTDSRQRVFCHEKHVRGEDITQGTYVSFQLQMHNGKQEASMVQCFSGTQDRHKRAALCSTRGADYPRGAGYKGPVPPKLLMMSREEAAVMLEMGMTVEMAPVVDDGDLLPVAAPHLDKICVLPPCQQGLPDVNALFSTVRFEVAKAKQFSADLSAIKSQLDEKDIRVWKGHTKKTLLNKEVTIAVRDRIRAEMCTIAFLKMFEMLSAYDLVVPPMNGKFCDNFNTLHLCEAPGI
jgi:cold shock CspA family protein